MGMLDELFTKKYAVGDVVTDGIKGKKKKPADDKGKAAKAKVKASKNNGT